MSEEPEYTVLASELVEFSAKDGLVTGYDPKFAVFMGDGESITVECSLCKRKR